MATYIFGGLTAVALILSIWMGYKNNTEFEKQVELKKNAESTLAGKQDDLAELKKLRDETVAKKEADQAENTERGEVLTTLTSETDSLQSDIDGKESKIASNQSVIDERNEKLSALPDPNILIPQLADTKEKIASLKVAIASSEDDLANVTQQTANSDALAASKREVIQLRSSGKSLPSLSTTVKSVYNNWGFVMLNGGNAQGVVPGSVLDVLRNGEVVAKLKVTAVEQNRAAADIMLDALPVTVAVRTGDRVVAEKAQ